METHVQQDVLEKKAREWAAQFLVEDKIEVAYSSYLAGAEDVLSQLAQKKPAEVPAEKENVPVPPPEPGPEEIKELFAEAWKRGVAEKNAGRWDEAIKAFQKAMTFAGTPSQQDAVALKIRFCSARMLDAEGMLEAEGRENEDSPSAERFAPVPVEPKVDSFAMLWTKGVQLKNRDKYEEAAYAFEEAASFADSETRRNAAMVKADYCRKRIGSFRLAEN